jgi:hypothetical protein
MATKDGVPFTPLTPAGAMEAKLENLNKRIARIESDLDDLSKTCAEFRRNASCASADSIRETAILAAASPT